MCRRTLVLALLNVFATNGLIMSGVEAKLFILFLLYMHWLCTPIHHVDSTYDKQDALVVIVFVTDLGEPGSYLYSVMETC